MRNFLVNPTGRFVIGGPMGDCGLTGRKIIVDTYGGMARHGGGAFSGKDPSKVDRSAAYAARWVAKNIVAAGLADRAEVQVAYAIGVAHPVSVMVETFGTEKIGRGQILALVDEHFDLRPGAFREELQPAPPDLPEDRGLRALRPRRPRLHLGGARTRRARCARRPGCNARRSAARRAEATVRRRLLSWARARDRPGRAAHHRARPARPVRLPHPGGAERRRHRIDARRAVRPARRARRRRRARGRQRDRRRAAARAAARARARRSARPGGARRLDRARVLLDAGARPRARAARPGPPRPARARCGGSSPS